MTPTHRVEILTLVEDNGTYSWEALGERLWTQPKMTNRINRYSTVGVGSRGAEFRVYRATGLTLHHAIKWSGRHYLLTNIAQDSPTETVISAALVEPVTCTASQLKKDTTQWDGETQKICTFPTTLTTKWEGYNQEQPQIVNRRKMVLVTPKAIQLKESDLVDVGDKMEGGYIVQVCNLLGEYLNEYEITSVMER